MGVPCMTPLPMMMSERLSGDARVLGYLTAASGLGALSGALLLASMKSVRGIGSITLTSAFVFGVGLIHELLRHGVRGHDAVRKSVRRLPRRSDRGRRDAAVGRRGVLPRRAAVHSRASHDTD